MTTTSSSQTPWPKLLLERTQKPAARTAANIEARRFLARLREDHEDFALSLRWLEQAVDGTPSSAPASTLRALVSDVRDVEQALARALAAADHDDVVSLFAEDTPLVRYLQSLYDWCEHLVRGLEGIAGGLRRGDSVGTIFPMRLIDRSFSRLDALTGEIHEELRRLESTFRDGGVAVMPFDHRLEELFWAASWLHLSLTRRFGA